MAAGLGFKDFVTGEVLTAADVDGYLMQGIWVFASAAARDAAVTSPQEGNFAFTKDTNGLWYYDGAAWVASGATGDIEGVTAGIGISGGGTSGTVTVTNSMATAIDAKGDLVAGTGADTFARLAVGANDTVLTADSSTATGLKWSAPASGGMTLLSTTSLSGSSTTVSSISGSYTDLQIRIIDAYGTSNGSSFDVRVNSDTGSNYNGLFIYPTSTSSSVPSVSYKTTQAQIGQQTSSSTQGDKGQATLNFYNYTSTGSKFFDSVCTVGVSGTQQGWWGVCNYTGGSAMTSFTILTNGGSFSGGSIEIYGVK